MQVACSYCGSRIGEKEPFEDQSLSHGMCDVCRDHFVRQWKGLSLDEYLDSFDRPVLVVSPQGRLVAANQRMAQALGQSQQGLVGLLGGEAMECVYARLPEGCGNTVHCETCTIRQTVTETAASGEPQHARPAYVRHAGGVTEMLISTELIDDAIQVMIETIPAG